MALVIANRVQETTTTTGTGTVTLAGAASGFQSFAVVGNTNTTYYTITSGTDWEVGIGTYSTTGPTLARTTILSSSNANAAITLTGTSTVFSSYPAEKVISDGYGLLPVANGGTGQSSYTDGQLLVGNTTGNTLTKTTLTAGTNVTITNGSGSITINAADQYVGTVTSVGGTGTVNGITLTGTVTTSGSLTLGGTLSGVSLTSQVTGTLPVANGGTGATTLTANGVLYGSGASAIAATAAGTTGQVLVGNTGSAPTWSTLSGIGVTSFSAGTTGLTPSSATTGVVTLAGTLGVANGGTGATTLTSGYLLKGNGTSAVSASVVYDNGTNVGIGTANVNGAQMSHLGTLRFLTASTERMRIDSSGNVLINRSSYSGYGKLNVEGGADFTNGNVIMCRDSGNVGVGTASPLSRLDVREANRADSTNITNVGIYTTTAQSTGVGGTLALGGLFNGSDLAPFGSIRGGKQNSTSGNYDGYLAFQTISNGGVLTEKMRITSAGQLCVGRTSSLNNGALSVLGTGAQAITTQVTVDGNSLFQGFNASTALAFQVTGGGETFTSSSFRGPIFYDSNNTSYYLDPASNSTSMRTNGAWVSNPTSAWGGDVAAKLEYHNNRWYASVNTAFVVRSTTGSEVFWAYNTGVVEASNDFRAPTFYDSNNTAFYADMAGTSEFNTIQTRGGSGFRTFAAGSASISSQLYFADAGNTRAWNWQLDENNNAALWNYNGSSWDKRFTFTAGSGFTAGGSITALVDMRAPIFYDSDNTAYYVDPASGSVLGGQVSFAGGSIVASNGDVYARRSSGATGVYYFADGITKYLYWDGSAYFFGAAGYTQSDVSMRAPIFYDSNNTAYYFDGASTSRWTTSNQDGFHTFNNYGLGIVGTYSPTRYQLVWALGDAYKGNADGTSLSGAYGLWFSYPSAGGPAANLSTHGLMLIENGAFRASLDPSMRAVTDMRAPIFYDYDNTGYYVDPAGSSVLGIITAKSTNDAQLYLNGNGTSWAGIQWTDVSASDNMWYNGSTSTFAIGGGGSVVANKKLHINGGTTIGSGIAATAVATNGLLVETQVSAPIYYDSGNTAYYLDPAGTTALNINGQIQFAPNTAQISGNDTSSYGSIAIRGARNGWYGIHIQGGGNVPHLMFSGANGGIYFEGTGRWASYYNHGDNCWGFGGSATSSAYNIYCPTGVYSGGRVDGTIFYDSNDTNYYINPNASSAVKGAIVIGPNNSYTQFIRLGGEGQASDMATVCTTNGNLHMDSKNGFHIYANYASNGNIYLNNGGGFTEGITSIRAPIFYDSNNTAYYVDPNSTSNVSAMVSYSYQGNGNVGGTGSASWHPSGIYSAGYNWLYGGIAAGNGDISGVNTMAANIYYDNGNTAYYVDPASRSNLLNISLGGGAGADATLHLTGSVGGYDRLTQISPNAASKPGLNIMSARNGSNADLWWSWGVQTDDTWKIQTGVGFGGNGVTVDTSGNFTASGNVTAYSDARLKKDVTTIEGALDLVGQMRGVTYTRVDTGEDGVGVIAQEMLEVLPQVVQQGIGDDDTLSVAYGNLVGVLIEAIKELTARVAELEGK
jgi:hypothetical protein